MRRKAPATRRKPGRALPGPSKPVKTVYLVSYIVSREEHYRIVAVTPEHAQQLAFGEGTYIASGETTRVEEFSCAVIDPATKVHS